jgi:uncharacterized membrane protein YfcA
MDTFWEFAIVGFFAQLVDGSLGMGFGVISSAVLLAQGVPPALVSATVNAAKLPTGATAAASNYLHKNINWTIVIALAIFGSLGGILGASMLAGLKGPALQYMVNGYLILIGGFIVYRGLKGIAPHMPNKGRFRAIGFVGGLIEGIGGSWGPIVNTGLLGSGVDSRYAIGSTNVSEFIVSAVVFTSLTLSFYLGFWGHGTDWSQVIVTVAGLTLGGLPAAFFGGWLAKRAPRKPLTIAVGLFAMGVAVYRFATM